MTSSSLCPFDMYLTKGTGCTIGSTKDACYATGGGTCLQSPQFRLIFTPDVQPWPAYKLNASNPGQFYGSGPDAGGCRAVLPRRRRPANDAVATSLTVGPGATVIFGTSAAVGISVSSSLGGSFSKGSARILATSKRASLPPQPAYHAATHGEGTDTDGGAAGVGRASSAARSSSSYRK